MNIAEHSKSFNIEDDVPTLFRAMFHDSKIVEQFNCCQTKSTYLLNFAIAPHIKQEILSDLTDTYFSIAFDESDGLMTIAVRYYREGSVFVELLGVQDMNGKYDADSCVATVLSTVESYSLLNRNWISEATDTCNTMRGNY